MPHDPTHPSTAITPHTPLARVRLAAEQTPPAVLRAVPLEPQEIPPGVQYVTLPDGRVTLAYTHPTHTEPEPAPVASQPVPAWAKTTALLAPTIGIGLHFAAPGLIAMAHALWATVALIAAGAFSIALLRGRRPKTPPITHHTHVTANGLFGRASNTINH
ncbi:Hypothetical protein XNRR2_2541 [Streptomyces albidoflavus]|uniref:hypothetical protein n=1 Tax=Streptomyces TaxID=1883 RepID=UPI0001AED0E9|nr:hypothetical protein [Streptomyces albidoflavus]BDH51595.1 hypothetical protein MTP02_26060 [Streptomyces albus]AGI88912.1 Hypothetical protein XNR_2541 [Streptomyces albidoflavus]EFE82946.1 predicted protein [Streptomyces albidoflavus]QLP92683.1 Hypothetical protein XNRR2_2541 [Streptomyces albidoflavus]WAE11124.1 Hypothetical protein SAD14_2541 [Streptomyces albidoflavus]